MTKKLIDGLNKLECFKTSISQTCPVTQMLEKDYATNLENQQKLEEKITKRNTRLAEKRLDYAYLY